MIQVLFFWMVVLVVVLVSTTATTTTIRVANKERKRHPESTRQSFQQSRQLRGFHEPRKATHHTTVVQEEWHWRDLQTSDLASESASSALTTTTTTTRTFSNEYGIPFTLIWNLGFENDVTVREPTTEEYVGLLVATVQWMIGSVQDVYDDDDTNMFAFHRIHLTHYGTRFDGNANDVDIHPSTIGMNGVCYFQANNEHDIPSLYPFLVAFSQYFNRTSFVEDYLLHADPQTTSIFHFVNATKLQYNILPGPGATSTLPPLATTTTTTQPPTTSLTTTPLTRRHP